MQRDRPLQVAKAKKVVADFCKAVANPIAQSDLMLAFLEQGNAFTVEYGDVGAGFYKALLTMASRAAETICVLPQELQQAFRDRFAEVVQSSSGIGWGYHDELVEIYGAAFPDRD
jgi:4-hydroxy-3-methylbut-2-enyl diphosphate reductase IspH